MKTLRWLGRGALVVGALSVVLLTADLVTAVPSSEEVYVQGATIRERAEVFYSREGESLDGWGHHRIVLYRVQYDEWKARNGWDPDPFKRKMRLTFRRGRLTDSWYFRAYDPS